MSFGSYYDSRTITCVVLCVVCLGRMDILSLSRLLSRPEVNVPLRLFVTSAWHETVDSLINL